jgi:hypothetical protein
MAPLFYIKLLSLLNYLLWRFSASICRDGDIDGKNLDVTYHNTKVVLKYPENCDAAS